MHGPCRHASPLKEWWEWGERECVCVCVKEEEYRFDFIFKRHYYGALKAKEDETKKEKQTKMKRDERKYKRHHIQTRDDQSTDLRTKVDETSE